MDKKDIKERVEKLRRLINYHRHLYHTFDNPEKNIVFALPEIEGALK